MNQECIYKNKEGKLILPTFLYDLCYRFNLSGNSSADDFAVFVVTKLAGKISSLDNKVFEFNSNTRNYYSGLYSLINKNGGLESCDILSDYTNGDENEKALNDLIEAGIVIKEIVEFDNDGEIVINQAENKGNNLWKSIQKFNIIRNSEKYIILPDEIYNAYKNFDGDNPYSFAKFFMNLSSDNAQILVPDITNFYASVFKLIETEGNCVLLSDYCKNNKEDSSEYLKKMILAQKAYMYEVKLENNGKIKERGLSNVSEIENTIYTINQGNENKSFYSFIDTEVEKFEEEFRLITKNVTAITEQKYNEVHKQLNILRNKAHAFYNKAREKACSYKNLLVHSEQKYAQIMGKIEKISKKAEKEYENYKKSQNDAKDVDYYKQITEAIDNIEKELTSIMDGIVITSEKDYMATNSKLTALRDKLYEIFDTSIKSANEEGNLTLSIVQEASKKHNIAMTHVNESINKLEELKNKIVFSNIFNT